MSEKRFNCVLGKDYHIINNNVDNMNYYLQDGDDVVLLINLLNRLVEENEQLKKENQRVYGIIEDGGVLNNRLPLTKEQFKKFCFQPINLSNSGTQSLATKCCICITCDYLYSLSSQRKIGRAHV